MADLQDDDGDLQASVKTILNHMEKHYNTLKPRDITRILVDFNKPYDDSLTPAQYFKRQQKCRTLLKKSPEPISDATMVRTSLGHFLQLPHMDKACDDWETQYPTDAPGTWLEFKQFFTKKFFNYQNHQASLHDAGVANSAIRSSEVDSIYAELAALRAASQTKDDQLSLLVERLQHGLLPSPPAVSDTASLPSIVTNPSVTSTPQDITAIVNQAIAQALAAQAPPPAQQQRRNDRRQRPPRTKRRYNNSNYCWTHGCDLHENHTSSTCKNPKPGHQRDATLTNMKGGSTQHLHLVCLPAPTQPT